MTSLSFSQLVVQPSWDLRREYYNLAERHLFGIEIVSLALPPALNDGSLYDEQLRTYRIDLSGFPGFRSIHGPFIDITPHSADASIAAASRARVQRCLESAAELSCTVAIFHTGINPLIRARRYRTAVIDSQVTFWRDMLLRFPSVTIALENMWEPEPTMLRSIADQVGLDRLGVCFDCGHVNVFSGIAADEWVAQLSTHIKHMHWNDNTGDLDSELPVGDGTIRWDRLVKATTALQRPPTVTIEVAGIPAILKSIQFMTERGFVG